ncbi:hypothetical protein [Arthrobacter sp. zg-Y1171]|uniref:hypothetical protein n=1 Tax=Arthrobacter sp. zg-Y1171 TaxID=2964610 RepID=UPI002101F3B6|nr:hypothetical protein [Arthrobacter sp. zg-Y1171]MCQ1995057.1 hypothetical protein [Arthrobacter sp. zg-Y1171]UWX80891.1 hypothetical protein N2L00_10750 [Arthrobacter sp. zg-Y1171]
MRNKFAVPLIVLGVLLMLIGIGQRTFWAPPETQSVSMDAEGAEDAVVTVLEPELLAEYSDGVDITVRSDAPFTLAVGRANDVQAWVADAAAARLSPGEDSSSLAVGTDKTGKTAPNPAGSDLWVIEESGEGELSHDWKAPGEGDWRILIATDGTAPAPTDVTLTWENDATRPFAVPLIVIGALLAVLGLALAFLRSGSDGPRRSGRRSAGPDSAGRDSGAADKQPSVSGTTSAFTAAAPRPRRRRPAYLAAAAAAVLAAGSAPAAALAGESAAGSQPVIVDSQLTRILDSVAGTVEAGDAAKDASMLTPRVGGAAYAMRAANYAVAAKSADHEAPVPVAAETLRTQSIGTAADWPRTVVAVTQGEGNPVPQALLLVQDSARDNYKLVSAVQMLPASTFPQPPAATDGSAQIPADSDNGLAMSPQGAVAALADSLTNPEGEKKDTFGANRFSEDVVKFQQQVQSDPKNEFATNTFLHAADPKETYALRTADGGAIVFGYLSNTFSSTPKEAGDSVNLEGTVYQALTGETNTDKGIDVTHGEAVMLYVPASGGTGQALVVGAAQELLSANLK